MSVDSNVETANLDRETIVEARRVLTGMQDALTDEMVTRIASTVSDSVGLLDQLGRSGIDKAIPTITRLIENGDLERFAELVRFIGAAQDAVTDEMIVRLTDLVSSAMSLLDLLDVSGLDNLKTMLPRITALIEQLEQHNIIDDMVDCLNEATTQAEAIPSTGGGLTGMWKIIREPEAQETMQFLLLISKQFRSRRAKRQSAQTAK